MHKLLLVLIPAAAATTLILSPGDYETIPPEPARTESRLGEQRLKLSKAVELVVKATEGQVLQASIDPDGGEVSATAYGQGKAWSVVVGQDGNIVRKEEIPRFPGWPVFGEWTETDSGLNPKSLTKRVVTPI